MTDSKPHKRLLQRVRAGITWAQDPQWEGYEDAEQAYRELNELLDDAIDREKALEEQLEANRETFRLIAQACGEDGTEPDDWRAMSYPTPGEFALRAARQLRNDYDEAIEVPVSFPASRSDA